MGDPVPPLFWFRDPDGNTLMVVESRRAAAPFRFLGLGCSRAWGACLDLVRGGGQARGMGDVPGATTFHKPAEAYDRLVGRYSHELARALIDAAGVRPGARALDVGCGPGALTAELAALLGADRVAAVDPSPPFVERAGSASRASRSRSRRRRRCRSRTRVRARRSAQLVVNFMTDAHAGVREMRRVTRPGGTVAAAVWDYAGEMTLLRRFWDAAVALDPAAAERDEGRCMRVLHAEELGELWRPRG